MKAKVPKRIAAELRKINRTITNLQEVDLIPEPERNLAYTPNLDPNPNLKGKHPPNPHPTPPIPGLKQDAHSHIRDQIANQSHAKLEELKSTWNSLYGPEQIADLELQYLLQGFYSIREGYCK